MDLDQFNGKWAGLLSGYGLSDKQLSGKHTACPVCGGKDRFRFDDKRGKGTFWCNQCGSGDGIKLVQLITGDTFKQVIEGLASKSGLIEVKMPITNADDQKKRQNLNKIWSESNQISADDLAGIYLKSRSLNINENLRFNPSTWYSGDSGKGNFPAMIAKVHDREGKPLTVHRTYLSHGKKLNSTDAKKLMPSNKPATGGAIRLFPLGETLGVAEGIETAIAANMLFNIPVWSVVNTILMEKFDVPNGVKKLVIFADNDANYSGQKSAYALASRCVNLLKIEAIVKVPKTKNTDFADQLKQMEVI